MLAMTRKQIVEILFMDTSRPRVSAVLGVLGRSGPPAKLRQRQMTNEPYI